MAVKNNVADHWYPREDPQKQAKIEEFLNWQHLCIRKHCIDLFITKVSIQSLIIVNLGIIF